MRYLAPLIVAGLIVLAGCEREPPPPPEPEAPPPPTAQELYQQLRQSLGPLWAAVEQGRGMSRMQMEAAVDAFRAARQQVLMEENLPEAVERLKRDLSEAVTKSRREDRGKAAWLAIKSYYVLEPGSTRFDPQLRWANLVLARPEVRVRGFAGDGPNTYIFMDVTEPETTNTVQYRQRVGEEFHDVLRVLSIQGNNDWVVLEYLPLEQEFRVRGPSERRANPTPSR